MKKEHNEKWLLSKGWEKRKGVKVDFEEVGNVCDDRNPCFFDSVEDIEGIKKCNYYYNENYDEEFATDDLDNAIEAQEQRDKDDKVEETEQ